MVGYLASLKVTPHLLGPSGLRLRYGSTVDVTIPWNAMAKIGIDRRFPSGSRRVRLSEPETGTGRVFELVISNQTNIHLALRQLLEIPLPKGPEFVSEVHFFADRPEHLLTRANAMMEKGAGGPSAIRATGRW